ncbi:MAG: hypothetical protein KJZ78_23625, partial [Bryobacteraceae bacterium]|nr:hypothetical protein [Bryobacteraceae bacterium]
RNEAKITNSSRQPALFWLDFANGSIRTTDIEDGVLDTPSSFTPACLYHDGRCCCGCGHRDCRISWILAGLDEGGAHAAQSHLA